MLTLKQVRYRNFLSTGNNYITIPLDSYPLTFIVGNNGAGKSTILEAVIFGLYGKPYRKITKAKLVNSINKKQCEVIVDFSIKGDNYRIIRGIKPDKLILFKNGQEQDQLSHMRDMQGFIEDNLLRVNLHTARQILALGTAGYTPFLSLSAADRRRVVENLLDLGIFPALRDMSKNELKDLSDEYHSNNLKLTEIISQLETISGFSAFVKGQKVKLKKEVEEYRTNEKLINECDDEISELRDKMNAIDNVKIGEKMEEIRGKLDKLKQANFIAGEKIKNIEKIEQTKICPTCGQEIKDNG